MSLVLRRDGLVLPDLRELSVPECVHSNSNVEKCWRGSEKKGAEVEVGEWDSGPERQGFAIDSHRAQRIVLERFVAGRQGCILR